MSSVALTNRWLLAQCVQESISLGFIGNKPTLRADFLTGSEKQRFWRYVDFMSEFGDFELEDIYSDLLMALGGLNQETWRVMRRRVGIVPYQTTCSRSQWVRLWAYAALRRQSPTKKIALTDILEYLATHGDDPRAFFPGLVMEAEAKLPSVGCLGADLRAYIFARYRLDIPASTLDRYCRQVLREGFKQFRHYSGAEVEALVKHRGRMMGERQARAVDAGNKLVEHNRRKRESARLNMRSA